MDSKNEKEKQMKSEWRDVWLQNYYGKSDEAKELEGFMKSNYKGHNYIPWATMLRLMYIQDPNSDVWAVKDENSNSFVHSYRTVIVTNNGTAETMATVITYNVVLEAIFFGKKIQEIYPIQDNSYNAPKVIDSNMVNKALQRAKAKIISTITGLAFKLYENGDLQFEDDAKEPVIKQENVVAVKKEESKKVTAKVKKEEVKEATVSNKLEITGAHKELFDYIRNEKNINLGLQVLNTAFIKKFNFAITTDDSDEELISKILKMEKPETSISALKKIIADKVGE